MRPLDPIPLLAHEGAALGGLEWTLIGVIAILLYMIWVLTHHRECPFDGEPEGKLTDNLTAVAGSTYAQIVGGNSADLVRDAAFFDVVCDEIGKAENSVHVETFMWEEGRASDRVVEALVGAAGRGVAVRVMVDARGSAKMGDRAKNRLRDAGCELALFHSWTIQNLGQLNVRDHRKVLVIDGRTAFVGGHCICDRWLFDTPDRPRFTDISARISGPVVGVVQMTFFENWYELTGNLFVDATTFPTIADAGSITAHVASLRPDGCASGVQILHYLAIGFANETIRIQNPYFIPDPRGADALVRAAKRGVDVRVMTPAIAPSDTPFVQRAGHFIYGRLLEGGVRIYEYQPSLMHQKTITIDGDWAGVGSCNFDDRSFEINDEITVGYADRGMAAELDAIFDSNIEKCEERTLDEWKRRPLWKRSTDFFHYLFNEQF